jgi:Tol biopolymer transport system component
MTARARVGRFVVVAALSVAGLGALAVPAPAQVPGKNGKVVFTRVVNGQGDVWVMKADGSGKRNLTNTPDGDERDAVISPHGDVIAFVRSGLIYLVGADGSQPPRVLAQVNLAVCASQLAWSPDGFTLLFRGNNCGPGPAEIYATQWNYGRYTNLTNSPGTDEADPAWSPIGNTIAFVSDRTGNREVFTAKADGSGPQNISNTGSVDESTPRFSPDGKKLAYVAPGNDGKPDVFVRKLSGGAPANITNNAASDTAPSFSADGKKLLFSSDRGGDGDVFVSNPSANAAATDLSQDASDPKDDITPDWGAIQELNCSIRPGFNVIIGTSGNDKIKGTSGPDQIIGLGGNDKIDGGAGNDQLCGGPGKDTLVGGKGKDLLVGGADDDILTGNGGRDALDGGSGNDQLSGGAGDDSLDGGPGNDTLRGDGGKDLFTDRKGRNTVTQ